MKEGVGMLKRSTNLGMARWKGRDSLGTVDEYDLIVQANIIGSKENKQQNPLRLRHSSRWCNIA